MMNAKFAKTIASIGIAAACMAGLAACSGNSETSGVAATVNGVEISEEDVTNQIENIRNQVIQSMQNSDETLSADDAWGQYLVAVGETPESLREEVIDSLVDKELVKSGAADKGVTIDEEEVESYVKETSSQYESQEKWEKALSEAGITEDEYRDMIRTSLTDQALQEQFTEAATADEASVLETAKTYVSYYDGAKRSSHILFKVEDTSDEAAMKEAREKAQEVLDRINSGEIDFADAAKEYSDDSSAENGGDVGWDRLNSFVTEYTTALDGLELDQVSDLVESEFGIHIIKCTEVFTAPEELTSMDQIPEAFRTNIEDVAKSSATNDAYQKWIDEMKEAAEIVINPIPANAPYNIDLTPYQQPEDTSGAAEEEPVDEGTSAEVEETSAPVEETSAAVEETSADVAGE